MAKFCTTLFIIALLVCSISLIDAARPIPVSNHENAEIVNAKIDDNESCEGVNEEECLMRRTLVAHTDYIYTQHKNP